MKDRTLTRKYTDSNKRPTVSCEKNRSGNESNFSPTISILFIWLFNQLDAQNLFHNKFYFMPLHVSSTCAHHQEVKIALHSLWYHHTYRWTSRVLCVDDGLVCRRICSCIPDSHLHTEHETATYRCDDTRGCVMQFWPPDDEHMCSKHVEA